MPPRRTWTDTIDPSTIPEDVIKSEYESRILPAKMRKIQASRKSFGSGSGRPRKLIECPLCTAIGGTAEMRRHKCRK